jgi:HlyD family secretion protein
MSESPDTHPVREQAAAASRSRILLRPFDRLVDRLARTDKLATIEEAGAESNRRQLRRYQVLSYTSVGALVLGLGGWAALSSIQGAVIVPGMVVVETMSKRVQHLEGGIVAEIKVKNGQQVKAGEAVLRLDDTDVRASLQITEAQLEELQARRHRLMAERDDSDRIYLVRGAKAGDVGFRDGRVWDGQERLLTARRAMRVGRKQQMLERITQLEAAISGLESQNAARKAQSELTRGELVGIQKLESMQLTSITRINTLKREIARLDGEMGATVADIARTRVQISEMRSRLLEDEQTYVSEILNDLRETEGKIVETNERRLALEAKLKRTIVPAPRNGIVHNLTVHTIGGVLSPGETFMEIVPEEDVLVIDGRVASTDITHAAIGQLAAVRFTSLDSRETPELKAIVTRLSPSVSQDGKDGVPYYTVRVELPEAEIAKLKGKRLIPGMPAEVFIETGQRSALNYLVKPMLDQIAHVWRER